MPFTIQQISDLIQYLFRCRPTNCTLFLQTAHVERASKFYNQSSKADLDGIWPCKKSSGKKGVLATQWRHSNTIYLGYVYCSISVLPKTLDQSFPLRLLKSYVENFKDQPINDGYESEMVMELIDHRNLIYPSSSLPNTRSQEFSKRDCPRSAKLGIMSIWAHTNRSEEEEWPF